VSRGSFARGRSPFSVALGGDAIGTLRLGATRHKNRPAPPQLGVNAREPLGLGKAAEVASMALHPVRVPLPERARLVVGEGRSIDQNTKRGHDRRPKGQNARTSGASTQRLSDAISEALTA